MASRAPRVVVTRRAEQAPALCAKLEAVGLTPLIFPTIELVALLTDELDAALAELPSYDWLIFTSVNAVDFFFRRVDELGEVSDQASRNADDGLPSIAVVGKATARALEKRELRLDFMPTTFTGAALAAELDTPEGQKILLPRAKAGGHAIVDGLRARGAMVTDIPLYATVTAAPTTTALAELAQGFEVIIFASPSSVYGLLEIAEKRGARLKQQIGGAIIACIGPVTADAARERGLAVTLMPDEYTLDALVQSLVDHFNTSLRTTNGSVDAR